MEPEGTLQREPNWELLASREIPPRDHGLRAGWGADWAAAENMTSADRSKFIDTGLVSMVIARRESRRSRVCLSTV